MFVRIFTISVIALLLLQDYVIASVIAAVVRTSASSYSCGSGSLACCMEDQSQPGSVNDEQCQDYSGSCCPSNYLPSCCYTVYEVDYYYCNETTTSQQ
ncbi:uncharacterized protein F5891DRAFT_520924 [Suillus fuscotomentosus]|uniref:Uncharacterized protein n=1 Tax=Suillus fuscotomentosus TaxID=1912939 RepID=A0AAD4E0N1_9AGAM|nr:uncharacterized protein F5891DRAFT_520924 [Suillus fuscotomentosus]KAG1897531.1 hypothetical protein F5891DRAFT_520924 [Suillus fuscotomentosus]